MNKQSGFTLIELVMVIVILGILAAVALPKFADLSTDAKKAAIKGVAASLASGGVINYAQRSLNSASGIATSGVLCATVAGTVLEGGVPDGYGITGTVGTVTGCLVDTTPTATSAVTVIVPAIL